MEERGHDDDHASLPDDCWELIFHRLVGQGEEEEFDSVLGVVSLVCNQFLSITNGLKLHLIVYERTAPLLPKLLHRFQHLKKIEIIESAQIRNVVHQIYSYGLNHLETIIFPWDKLSNPCVGEYDGLNGFRRYFAADITTTTTKKWMKRKCLKILDCGKLYLQDSDLIAIADLFPCLEKIKHNGDITDDGVDYLATKLKDSLRSISFYGYGVLTDRSLISLSSNCCKLRKLHIFASDSQITENGVGFVMRHSPNLTSLSLIMVVKPNSNGNGSFTIENSIRYSRNLRALYLRDFSDQLVRSIAGAHPPLPLKKLEINSMNDSNQYGLKLLFKACHESLEVLTLDHLHSVFTDHFMSNLFQHLPPRLTYIQLSCCLGMSPFRLYTLLRNCLLLRTIIMRSVSGDVTNNFPTMDLHKNYQMRHLSAENCDNWLDDETLKKIGLVCPNLEILRLSYCSLLTSEGIGEILNSCCSTLRELEINFLPNVVSNFFRRGDSEQFTMANLRKLIAYGTKINDEAMTMIGKRCPHLQVLDITVCQRVTSKGVKEVVRNCKKLREIDLFGCKNVRVDILFWMLVSSPSLKHIVPPCNFVPKEQLKNLFLRFGCQLEDGVLPD